MSQEQGCGLCFFLWLVNHHWRKITKGKDVHLVGGACMCVISQAKRLSCSKVLRYALWDRDSQSWPPEDVSLCVARAKDRQGNHNVMLLSISSSKRLQAVPNVSHQLQQSGSFWRKVYPQKLKEMPSRCVKSLAFGSKLYT